MDLLQRQGIRIVALDDEDGLEIDGVYFETDELGACVAANLRKVDWTGFRAAFTVAHEYVHWLLQDVRAEGFLLGHNEDDGLQEVRANAFAAAFLMPPDGLRLYLRRVGLLKGEQVGHLSQGDLVRAMDHFGVSKLALLFRLQNLQFLDAERAKELRELSLNATAVAERLGLELRTQPYVATRLPILAIECWRKGLLTTGRAAELLEMDVGDFKDFMTDIGEQQEIDEGEDLLGAAALAG
jgi:Zn-dependent peptidase ImmA (M78 family)